MTTKIIKVKSNLEASTAAMFVQTASKFSSEIKLQIGNKNVNGKSIMGLISLGIIENVELEIIAEGADEGAAVKELEFYLNSI